MVNQVSALGRNGVFDWLMQRASALIVLSYVMFLVFFLVTHSPLAYHDWQLLFTHRAMRVFTVLVALAIAIHAWIGLWGVLMDYVKCSMLRLFIKLAVVVMLLVELIWLIDILWG
jgi:succinate dehydrogenase / fumarate reductase, membrane anchor subunit